METGLKAGESETIMRRTTLWVVLLGLVVTACTGDTAAESVIADTEGATRVGVDAATTTVPSGSDQDEIGAGAAGDVLAGRKIIRQASLVVQDADPEAVLQEIVQLVEGAGGFVASSDLQRTVGEDPPRIDVTLRLPSGSLSATMAAIGSLVDEVLSRQLGSSDVTAQYLDIEARLRNLETLESELLILLTEVRDVTDPEATDLLLVFDRLQSVRLEIEQLVGQRQAFDDQVDLATLRITIVPTPAEVEITDDSWNPMRKLRESLASLVDVLENLADFAIWAGVFLLPVLALIAIPVVLAWWLITRRGRVAAVTSRSDPVTDEQPAAREVGDENEVDVDSEHAGEG